jgi:signal transduction histidine kinase
MRFTHKITFGFSLVAALALVMVVLFFGAFREYGRSNHLVFLLNHLRSREQALHNSIILELQAVRDGMDRPDAALIARARAQALKTSGLIAEILQVEEGLARDLGRVSSFPKERLEHFTHFQQELKGYEQRLAHTQAMVSLTPGTDRSSARRLVREFEERINGGFLEMEENWDRNIGLVMSEIQREKNRAGAVLLVLAGATFAVSTWFTISLATAARSLIRRLRAAMRRVANGDFSQPVPLGGDAEINELAVQFNRMADDLEELEELRTEVVSMLSHDLKSPLAIIKMHAEALAKKGKPDDQSLHAITRSADRMLRLVENFLDASRPESRQLELALRPVSLGDLLRRVREDGQMLARSRGVTVALDEPDHLPWVLADEEHLERAVHNLVSNAIKYNRPEGLVTLEARVLDDQVRLAVADTGVGISEADRRRLFEKYFRSGRTRHIGGTGLGLAVTREIVRAHGGDLEVESREGEGATFSFLLRRAPASDLAGAAAGGQESAAPVPAGSA